MWGVLAADMCVWGGYLQLICVWGGGVLAADVGGYLQLMGYLQLGGTCR